jgi:hypothetical protein
MQLDRIFGKNFELASADQHSSFKFEIMPGTRTSIILISLLFLVSCVSGASNGYVQPVYVYPGVGLGTIIAVVLSWNRNQSILWAIIHGLLGWLYVIYVLIVGKKKD